MPAEWAGRPVLVRWQFERTMYDFKNSFSPAFVYIHRAKYIFPETGFAYPISEQKFKVCYSNWVVVRNILIYASFMCSHVQTLSFFIVKNELLVDKMLIFDHYSPLNIVPKLVIHLKMS